jgi:hypothetical protein
MHLEPPNSGALQKVNDLARYEEHEICDASALVGVIRTELKAVPRNILGMSLLGKEFCQWKES